MRRPSNLKILSWSLRKTHITISIPALVPVTALAGTLMKPDHPKIKLPAPLRLPSLNCTYLCCIKQGSQWKLDGVGPVDN